MLSKWQTKSSAITKHTKKRTMEGKMYLFVMRQESFMWYILFKLILNGIMIE